MLHPTSPLQNQTQDIIAEVNCPKETPRQEEFTENEDSAGFYTKKKVLHQTATATAMPRMKMPSGPTAVQLQVSDHQSMKSMKQGKDASFENFEELEDEFMVSDMDGSILNSNRSSNIKPSLPQRSEKRASKLLDNILMDLSSMDISKEQVAEQQIDVSDPHEQYLSSEEDISFSDYDDDLDSLVDFESSPESGIDGGSPPGSRGSSRKSQEDTARVVSFVTAGKPQIINIQIPSPQKSKPRPIDLGITLRPSPLKIHSTSAIRPLSVASTSSLPYGSMSRSRTMAFGSSPSLPIAEIAAPSRKASRLTSNLSSLDTNTKPSFLTSDPFPKVSIPPSTPNTPSSPTPKTPKTPKTPITMAAAAWKTSISRTLSIGRKHAAPVLSRAQTSAIVSHDQTLVTHSEGNEMNHQQQRQRAATTPQTPSWEPLQYDNVMKDSVGGRSHMQTKERTYSLGMYGLGRRKGMRGRNDRYVG